MVEHCNYGEMIWDRIVVRIHDATISERLQLKPILDLAMPIAHIRQYVLEEKQQGVLRSANPPPDRWGGIAQNSWSDCTVKDAECRKFHKKGYFAVVWRSSKTLNFAETESAVVYLETKAVQNPQIIF